MTLIRRFILGTVVMLPWTILVFALFGKPFVVDKSVVYGGIMTLILWGLACVYTVNNPSEWYVIPFMYFIFGMTTLVGFILFGSEYVPTHVKIAVSMIFWGNLVIASIASQWLEWKYLHWKIRR